MGRNLKIAVAAILALAIASCSSEGTQESSNPPPPDAPTANAPATNPPAVPKQAANQVFNKPLVPAKQSPPVASAANLIRPTNGTERERLVTKGRNDPFAQIVGSYTMPGPGVTVSPRPIPKLPPLPGARVPISRRSSTLIVNSRGQSALIANSHGQNVVKSITSKNLQNSQRNNIKKSTVAAAKISIKARPKPSITRVLPKVLPQVVPNPGLTAMAPPPPQPELARAVVVSGVVLIGREPQAIIKVPNEPTSRYVQAGQRLANGVLIKRIEMNEGSEPIVILEQYGIEVARMVGEGAGNDKQSPTASAGSSLFVTAPPQNLVPAGAT